MESLRSIFLLFLALSSSSWRICLSRKVETGVKEAKSQPVLKVNHSTFSTEIDPSKVIRLSWHPRAFLYKGFLSDEECDHLISLSHDNETRNSTISSMHANSGMFLARGQDEVVSKIEERISAWTFLPKGNGEDMQILHYEANGSYAPRYDYHHKKSKLEFGGHRIATVLMYLSDVTRGGETIFPQSESKGTQPKGDTWSKCVADGYAVKPVRGNALLFFNLHPDATPDESSPHGSCAVVEGEKWTAIKWIHVRAFDRKPPTASDGDCTDEDDNCGHWASVGECQRNPVYMFGTPDYYGSCRKSCGAC